MRGKQRFIMTGFRGADFALWSELVVGLAGWGESAPVNCGAVLGAHALFTTNLVGSSVDQDEISFIISPSDNDLRRGVPRLAAGSNTGNEACSLRAAHVGHSIIFRQPETAK